MVKKEPKIISASIHVHLKKPFQNEKKASDFAKKMDLYLDKEAKKAKLKHFSAPEGYVLSELSVRHFLRNVSKHFVNFQISVDDDHKSIRAFDSILNKGMSFLDISEVGIKGIYVLTTKTYQINKASVSRFFDNKSVAEFSTSVKKRFIPKGVVLSTGIVKSAINEENEFSIMISTDEGIHDIDFTLETRVEDKALWDILTHCNKTINDSKKTIFSTLGVREK